MLDLKLDGKQTNEDKLNAVSNLILQNEMKKFELSQRLESLSNSTVSNIPKLSNELLQQKEQIEACKVLIEASKKKILSEHQKSVLFDTLLKMDKVMDRMNETKLCLKDTDNWNTVEAEMEALFVSKDLDKAATRLLDAEKSLELLQNSSNYDERNTILISLKERFFEILKSDLSGCIADGNYQELFKLTRYFENLGRQDDIVDIYYELIAISINELWNSGNDFNAFLKKVAQTISDAEGVFSADKDDPKIQRLLFKIFSNLNPSIGDALAKQDSPNQIVAISDMFKACVQFGSLFTSITLNEDSWNYVVYHPFVGYQKKFKQLEEKYLNFTLKSIINSPQDICNINQIFALLESSIARFSLFTFGYANFSIVKMYDSFICSITEQLYTNKDKSSTKNTYAEGWEERPYILQFTEASEQQFHSYIDNVKQLVHFYFSLEAFLSSLQTISNANLETIECKPVVPFIKMIGKPKIESVKPEALYHSLKLISFWQNKVVDFLVQDAVELFEQIPQMSVWSKSKNANEKFQFSLSPLPYITSVGEYLLAIPQKFENYFSESWINFGLKNLQELSPQDIESDTAEDEEIYHLWITSAVRTTELQLVSAILKIKELSAAGKKQLLADLQYLRNVMAALEITPLPSTSNILDLIQLDDVAGISEESNEAKWFKSAYHK
ncbi:Golgi transport complex subunit 7 [Terramyces sp. JEL0728]|nr:Golgi transport complex subunit 7 [Terramyces sp. JEL0728]